MTRDPKKKGAKKPSKAKPAGELTDQEAMRRLFPKPVRDEVKREAAKADRKAGKRGPGAHEGPS